MVGTTKGARREQLARYIREQTGDGQDLVNLYLAIQRDELLDRNDKPVKVTLRMRMDATEWLSDRGFGKAPQEIAIEASVAEDNAEELREWDLVKLEAGITVLEAAD